VVKLDGGTYEPTGTVDFEVSTDGGATWSVYDNDVALVSGSATSTSYTPSAPGTYYFRAIYSGDANFNGSQSGDTAEPLSVISGHIIVDKVTKPTSDPTVFSFTTTGGGYVSFTLTDADLPNNQELPPGDYTVTETVPANWLLTGLAGIVTGSGGSTFTVDLTLGKATIHLAAGDMVTITFEDTKGGQTRTQGFWATHLDLTHAVWFGGTVGGHTYTGVAGKTIGTHVIDNDGKLMGAFWSNIAKTMLGGKRSQLDQARMQLLQQLVAAILNNAAFGSSPAGPISIAGAKAAFSGTNVTAIRNATSAMAAFNQSGDTLAFTPGVAANGKQAKNAANLLFWNTLP
jgi:hypothetical protein